MHPIFRLFVTALTCSALLFAAPSLMAQETTSPPPSTTINELDDTIAPFSPGTIDLTFSAGLTNWSYLYVEPGLDIGILNVADGITLSAGGMINAGWCFWCAITELFDNYNLRSWYASPKGRVALHLNFIADALNIENLDLYGGVMAGPSYYSLTIEANQVRGTARVLSIIGGPYGGGRFTFSGDDGFFVYFDGRLLIEVGAGQVQLEVDGETRQINRDNYRRGGLDFTFGVGFRF